jgi:hypothetical protein
MARFKLDFLGIGAEKAASLWIANCLREHPDVCFARNKELFFFNEYDPHLLKVRNLKYQRGITWYVRQFPNCAPDKLRGEYSPTYLYGKKTARRIKKYFPDVKFIVCLRDPVKRAFSQYLHDKSIGVIRNISFEEALARQENYILKGFYHKHLSYYFKLFPRKNFIIVFIDDIKKDPKKVIKKIYTHIGVKNVDFVPTSLNRKENVASQARLHFLNYFLIHVEYVFKRNNLEWVIRLLEKIGVRKVAYDLNQFVNRKPLSAYPKINPDTANMLRKKYLKDIEKLERLLKINLSSWKSGS